MVNLKVYIQQNYNSRIKVMCDMIAAKNNGHVDNLDNIL